MNKSKINTTRLNTEVTIVENNTDTKLLKAEGITFEFDAQNPKAWVCTAITVTRNAREFESGIFFYMDWLEDILDSFDEIDQYALHYMLFALSIEQDLTIEG